MESNVEETQPGIYWSEFDPPDLVTDIEWLERCRRRLLQRLPGLRAAEAADLAGELGADDRLRGSAPEDVADEVARFDTDPFVACDMR